ncbi:MAG: hypothetical protein KZQ75_04155 [Candidatus Thiodiazotropha sp. (ex Myrtea spinifera)]|nr:hypothetical protein [Candidatus Thiodiazotropha sp. (ex Myrtea spinifera)]
MEASASFRFLSLNEDQAKEIQLLIPSTELGEHYQTGKIVASIKIIDSSLVVIIDEFRRKHTFMPTDCDVFVSIASEKQDEIWRAPKAVNYIINIVNCPIVFSYTC